METFKRIAAGFSAFWIAHAVHWYLVSEFSKFKRFDLIGSTMYATAFTAIGLAVGLVFRWPPANEAWRRAGKWSLLLSATGSLLLVYDYAGWRVWMEDSQTHWSRWPK